MGGNRITVFSTQPDGSHHCPELLENATFHQEGPKISKSSSKECFNNSFSGTLRVFIWKKSAGPPRGSYSGGRPCSPHAGLTVRLGRLVAFVAEEHDRPVTQSIATPEPGFRGSSRSSLGSWMCHHTREPVVLSRVSCRPAPEC